MSALLLLGMQLPFSISVSSIIIAIVAIVIVVTITFIVFIITITTIIIIFLWLTTSSIRTKPQGISEMLAMLVLRSFQSAC